MRGVDRYWIPYCRLLVGWSQWCCPLRTSQHFVLHLYLNVVIFQQLFKSGFSSRNFAGARPNLFVQIQAVAILNSMSLSRIGCCSSSSAYLSTLLAKVPWFCFSDWYRTSGSSAYSTHLFGRIQWRLKYRIENGISIWRSRSHTAK